ncbi:hypothetical protein SS30_19885, partial [Enterobacter roggenkampii]
FNQRVSLGRNDLLIRTFPKNNHKEKLSDNNPKLGFININETLLIGGHNSIKCQFSRNIITIMVI